MMPVSGAIAQQDERYGVRYAQALHSWCWGPCRRLQSRTPSSSSPSSRSCSSRQLCPTTPPPSGASTPTKQLPWAPRHACMHAAHLHPAQCSFAQVLNCVLHVHQGEYRRAERYFKMALTEAREGFGADDPHVAAACQNLAEAVSRAEAARAGAAAVRAGERCWADLAS